MSAYSEWKYGLIDDSQYTRICKEEDFWDRYYEAHPEYLEDEEEDEDEYDIYFD